MKLAISNIAWKAEQDAEMYTFLQEQGIEGLEIAPTRIFPENPYEKIEEAGEWAKNLKDNCGLVIPSMQSIWFGRNEKIFAEQNERDVLLQYTKKAVDFAAAINCKNLVFGCPRNRSFEGEYPEETAQAFFKELGDYAYSKGTVLAMEANPPIYNTNFVNETKQAFELVKKVDSPGFLVNVDLGTMIHNDESIEILEENMKYVNHIHISEPGLALIGERKIHNDLAVMLKKHHYDKSVSIEMKTQESLECVKATVRYIKGIFADM